MDTDTLIKFIYAIGITGSIVTVSFFLVRLLIKLAQRVDELERTTENLGEMAERANEQMDTVESIVEGVKGVSENILQPLSAVAGITKYIKEIVDSFSSGSTTNREPEEE